MKKKITKSYYTIDDHPEPAKVYEWVRDNWHDLNQHTVDEMIETLKKVAIAMECTLDYAICQVPARDEQVTFISNVSNSHLLSPFHVRMINNSSYNCDFTGMVWDCVLSDALRGFDKRTNISVTALGDAIAPLALKMVHDDSEYKYSDEGLKEHLEINEYYFDKDGAIE